MDTPGVLVCRLTHFSPAGLLLFEALRNFLSQHYMVLNVCFALKRKRYESVCYYYSLPLIFAQKLVLSDL